MNREDIMFLLESIAYISGSLAAFVYIFDTYIERLNKEKEKIKQKMNRYTSRSSINSLSEMYDN